MSANLLTLNPFYTVHNPPLFVHSDAYLSPDASACEIRSVKYKCLLLNNPTYLEVI
jgi:hypothetical protein